MSQRQSHMPAQVSRARKAATLAVAGHARLRFMRSSAQKTRLVVNEIRGKRVDEARAFLRNCRKRAAKSVLKLIESAAENVRSDEKASKLFDLDELYVTRIEVGDGPVMKRVQPAPMGRAYQIKKRTCHVFVELGALGASGKSKGGDGGRAASARRQRVKQQAAAK